MHIVIIGAGFGGLRLARKLNNKAGFTITILDQYNYHQFQPLFYQVATAGLDASNISFPLRKVFHNSKNIKFRLCTVNKLHTHINEVETSIGNITYDQLVIATGANTNFFENNSLAANAFPMKSTVEALQLRHRIIQNFEDILTTNDEFKKQQLLNIVIVGGGPTGVELSGAIADMRKYVLPKDYPEIDFSKMNVYLLEGSGKVLGSMSEKSSANAKKYLDKLNVTVKLNTILDNYDGEVATLKDGTIIPTKMLIWAAGIKGNVPVVIDTSLVAKGNRIKIDNQCKVLGFSNVYAIGDVSYLTDDKFPSGLPQVAPMAIQMADLLAHNFYRLEMKSGQQQFKTFTYNDKGSMATVGRNLAVVDVSKKVHIKGLLAWLIWMGLHLMLILGVKNRFFVFLNWLYNYVTYDQNLRLIFKEFYRQEDFKLSKD